MSNGGSGNWWELFCGGGNDASPPLPDTPVFRRMGTKWIAVGTNLTGDFFDLLGWRGRPDRFATTPKGIVWAIGAIPSGLGRLAVGSGIGTLKGEIGQNLFRSDDGSQFEQVAEDRSCNDQVLSIVGVPKC